MDPPLGLAFLIHFLIAHELNGLKAYRSCVASPMSSRFFSSTKEEMTLRAHNNNVDNDWRRLTRLAS
jgi:hypothetical protein